MRVVVFELKQESNSFSPIICGEPMFRDKYLLEPDDGYEPARKTGTELAGMIDVLEEEQAEILFAMAACSVSSGPVDRAFADYAINRLTAVIEESGGVDGVMLSLHGATQLTDYDDGIGLILAAARLAAGKSAVLAASTDYHANITEQVVRSVDILCGYQTYPHVDQYNTGRRAAQLGIDLIKGRKKTALAFIKLPMIHQAEACLNTEGPMKILFDQAREITRREGVYDFSIYQMQPWLNVAQAGASVLVIADQADKAMACADQIARLYWDIRKQLHYALYTLDEAIDQAIMANGQLAVISDSADSPSAGSPGDSTFVLQRLLDRGVDLEAYLTIMDPSVPYEAQKVGIGRKAVFTVGGKIDRIRARPIEFEATVKALSDGNYLTGPGSQRKEVKMGMSALLVCQNIYLVVTEKSVSCFDSSAYLNFGLDPRNARIVLAKSAIEYRRTYGPLTDRLYIVNTPGASSADLFSFHYDKIPRPMYPFDPVEDYNPPIKQVARSG